jgi:hypothetical protein
VFGVRFGDRGRESAGVSAEGGWRHPLPPRCRRFKVVWPALSPVTPRARTRILCRVLLLRALSGGNGVEYEYRPPGRTEYEYELGRGRS